tara:strand:- start:5633 stop:6430 length:798 start_codon:yes stop_codon:yes gene_type:complete
MKNKINFSIIVVSLNTKKDFLYTLKSILKQKLVKYQIIVVDGKSSDGTLQIINKYKKKIEDIIIEKDDGIYEAMNKGLKKTKFPWVIFLNSGDSFFYNRTLLKINSILNLNKEIDICIGNNVVNDEIKYISKLKKLDQNSTSSSFSHQSTVCKSSLFKRKKFDTKFKIAADYEFFKYNFYKKKKFYYSDLIISKSKPGGLSDKNRLAAEKEFYMINKMYKNRDSLYLFNYLKNIILVILKKFIKIILPKNIKLLILKMLNSQRLL